MLPENAEAVTKAGRQVSADSATTLTEAFARAVRRAPSARALSDGPRHWTFHQLDRASRWIAQQVRRQLRPAAGSPVPNRGGSCREPRVGLVAETRAESVAAILGILRAGAAYVPVDPAHPARRQLEILTDARVSVVVGDAAGLEPLKVGLAAWGIGSLEVPTLQPMLWPDDSATLAPAANDWGPNGPEHHALDARSEGPIDPEQLAYIIYTSGSTGRPKGVGVCHRTALHLIRATAEEQPCGPGDATTLLHSLAFDLSVWELWRPLLRGGRLVIVPRAARASGDALMALLEAEQITQLSLTPSALRLLLGAGFGPGRPVSLRHLFLGGEALELERLRPWLESRDPVRVEGLYGPTEATVWATRHRLTADDLRASAPPLGKPWEGWTTHLDASGEILLGGVALARGYVDRPALTAERFIPDPRGHGARVYRTGDRGRWRPAGDLEFLGRADDQVKIRGFRVELGEIEANLVRHPGLREAAVALSETADGRTSLVAHVVSDPDASDHTIDDQALREFLGERLPAIQVPARWVRWSRLPRLTSGKVDRRALALTTNGSGGSETSARQAETSARQAETPDRSESLAGSVSPKVPTELSVIWQEVLDLGTARWGVDESFFALGGHSLMVPQLRVEIEHRLGLGVALERFFERPTLAGLAAALVSADAKVRPHVVAANRAPSQALGLRRHRATAQQLAFWLADRRDHGRRASGALHSLFGWWLHGTVETAALVAAWERLVAWQPTLRSSFEHTGPGLEEIVAPSRGPILRSGSNNRQWAPMVRVDLGDLNPDQADWALRDLVATLEGVRFDLEQGPLWRSALVEHGPGRHLWLVAAHHIATDGWSQALAVEQWAGLIGPAATPPARPTRPAPSPGPRVPRASGVDDAELAQRLADLPSARLSADLAEPTGSSGALGRAGRRHGELGPRLARRVQALARTWDTTPAVVELALGLGFLARLLGVDRLAVGWPTARRRGDETGTLGCFADLWVVAGALRPVSTANGQAWADLQALTRATHRQTLALHAGSEPTFASWLRAARRPGDSVDAVWASDDGRHPLIQIVLAPQDFPFDPPSAPAITFEPFDPPPMGTRFDLEIHSRDGDHGGRRLDWVYDRGRFESTTIERWRRSFERWVSGALETPDTPLDRIAWMASAEWHQTVVEWNDTAAAVDLEANLYASFEAWARHRGNRVAVVEERRDGSLRTLTWSGLAQRSQRLARRLLRCGLRPEEPVGLVFERGLEAVVAMLAVVAAGGACLPLDPQWPTAHRQGLLRRAGARWWLRKRADRGSTDPVLDLESFGSTGNEPAGRPWAKRALGGDRLVYLMATSGSTGEPKLVAASHRGVQRLIQGSRSTRLDDDVMLHLAPAWFDAATLELWGILLRGRRLVLPPPGPLTIADITRWVDRHRVTTLWMTTPLFHQAVHEPLGRLRRLRQWFTGGEVLRPAVVSTIQAALPTTSLVNAYGPTENTTFSTCERLGPSVPATGRMAIGRPLTYDQALVVDDGLRPLPIGVEGEILVAGPGLARGYWQSPGRTAERFVPHPLAVEPGARIYRTGDRGRWLADGRLDFRGRGDRQVKIRGMRVEPAATEHCIARLDGVAEVAVVVEPGDSPRLVAVVVAEGHPSPGWLDRLATETAAILPVYQQPGSWRRRAALPLKASGKLDRRRLLAELRSEPQEVKQGRAPEGPAEIVLAKLWAQCLGREIDPEGNFFEQGGDSLSASRVVAELDRGWGVRLPLLRLFDNPTLAELAEELDPAVFERNVAAPRVDDVVSPLQGPPERASRELVQGPTTFTQRRLWLLAQAEPDDATYTVPASWRLEGDLDRRALEDAVADLVARHEGLRTRFVEGADGPLQEVVPPAAEPWVTWVDLSGLEPSQGEREARRLAELGARTGFDLARAPLWRLLILRLGPTLHHLRLEGQHVLLDGASLKVWCRDLVRAYTARHSGESPRWSSAAPRPRRVARDERQTWIQHQPRLEAYWRKRLGGLPPVDLPVDFAKTGEAAQEGRPARACAQVPWRLEPRTTKALRALAISYGATLWMALLASWFMVARRLGANPDAAVISPESGRGAADRDLIACRTELLVSRAPRLDALSPDDPSLKEFLEAVRVNALADLEHRGLPFDRLPGLLAAPWDRGRHPISQVSLAFHADPESTLDLPGLISHRLPTVGETTHLDLEIHLWQSAEEGLTGYAIFRRDLFDATTVRRWSGLFATLVAEGVASPEQPLSRLAGLGRVERHQLAWEWNDTARALPGPGSLHRLVTQRLAQNRHRIVLEGPRDQRWTGARLLDTANRLARALAQQGFGRGAVVGVCLPREPRQIAAFLAVLETGAAYLPLDPTDPPARHARLLADAGAVAWVVDAGQKPASREPLCLGLDAEGSTSAPTDLSWAPPPIDPGDAAYVLYTSGSTGQPKGVVVSHGAIVHHMLWIERALPLGPDDRLLQKTPAVFDASVWEHWLPLMTGARLVMAPEGLERDPEALVTALRHHRVTVLQVVPTQLRLLLTVPELATCGRLRRLVSGGEALAAELVARCREALPKVQVVNVYGPTEGTIHATWEPRPDTERPIASLGRALANTQAWVLDPAMRPIPTGVVGRLWLAGPGLARGYLGRPRATAQVFVPNPFVSRASVPPGVTSPVGERLYDTGDQVRWLPDGRLDYVGRADQQIKWRGVRLEPQEIEAALETEPKVRQAVVTRWGDGATGGLMAWLVAEGSERPSGAELGRRLRRRLPAAWIPGAWQWRETLPRTPGGKVDRRRLARSVESQTGGPQTGGPQRIGPSGWAPGQASEALDGTLPAPDGLAAEVQQIWTDVLSRDGLLAGAVVGPGSFFDQGGHSLLATQLLARIRQVFGVPVRLAELFARPTLADLVAAVARGHNQDQEQPPALDLDTVPDADLAQGPLTLAQRRLWFLHRLEPRSTAYAMPSVWRLRGPLDLDRLRRALVCVLLRQPALRCSFPEVDGQPRHRVEAVPRVVLAEIDLRSAPTALDGLLRLWAETPFDLGARAPFRAAVVRTTTDVSWFVLNIHHIVFDGWSAALLARALSAGYAGLSTENEPGGIVAPTVIAQAQQRWLTHPALDRQRQAWRERLEDLPALELSTDRRRPTGDSARSGRRRPAAGVDVGWDRALVERVDALARDQGATRFMVLLAALAAVLRHFSGGGSTVALGSPVAGRRQPELEGTIGFFVNLLVLRLNVEGGQGFDALLATSRRVALEAYDHQDLPFERLVEDLAPERSTDRNPLVSVSFALQNAPQTPLRLEGLKVEPRPLEPPETRFDLEVYLWQTPAGDAGRLVYRRDLFEATTMERLARTWRRILAAVCTNPDTPLDALPWLARSEVHQVIHALGAKRTLDHNVGSQPEASPVARVWAWAQQRPQAPAVRSSGDTWTYGALAASAQALAARLEALGVGPEVRVGLYLEPSAELVAAMVAVLAVGGAYVPLDPGHPEDRVRFALEDSAAQVLVTRSALVPPPFRGVVVDLDRDVPSPPDSDWCPRAPRSPLQLAYVIYTSGSTGRPKGVGVSVGALDRLFTAVGRPFDPRPDDVWSLFHSTAFDFSVWEIWGALVHGGAVAVLSREERRDPGTVLERLDALGVTVLDLTPSALRWLVDAGAPKRWPGRLRWVLFGGESLDPSLVEPWLSRSAEAMATQWANLYGITETTVHATWRQLTPEDVDAAPWRRGSPIGRPLADLKARVLSPAGTPSALGIPGELWVGGASLARGYLGRPGLTADRFRPDPSSREPGGRLYRSGDRVRWRSDGSLEFLGRLDDQVQLRGHRVEPGEVTVVLGEHPEVQAAAVVADRSPGGDTRLVAAVVPGHGVLAKTAIDPEDRVERWREVYDALYRGNQEAEVGFDIRGWSSAITGQPIPAAAMRGWRDALLERLGTLRPSAGGWRIWEIGCGSGMLLHGLAPRAMRYFGTDQAGSVLERLRQEAAERGLTQVELEVRQADDFTGVPNGSFTGGFDLVIVNSVAQYFTGGAQLATVLRGALRALAPGGFLFLGDLRNLALFDVYHAEVQRARGGGARDSTPWRRRIVSRRALEAEQELLVHPSLFPALAKEWPEVERARVWPRPGRDELARFRFDAVLERSTEPAGEPGERARIRAPWVNDPLASERRRAWERGLRRFLAGRLPEAMLPSVIEVVHSLPRTVNGKLDPEALRHLAAVDPPAVRQEVPSEEAGPLADLLGLWREVLERPVGLDDDFFELGGHSLLATRLVTRLRHQLGREVPLAWLFDTRTPRGLASRLTASVAPVAPQGPTLCRRPPVSGVEEIPLAPVAERLWFLERLDPEGGAYLMPAAWRMEGSLSVPALRGAIEHLVARHHSLRFAVVESSEGPRLRIPLAGSVVPSVLEVDLTSLDRVEAEQATAAVLRQACHQPFDLAHGGLLRTLVVRRATGSWVLGLVTHHLVFDGASETVVLRELTQLYANALAGQRPTLPPLEVEYADAVLWQRRWLDSPAVEPTQAYWRRQLAEAPTLELPLDQPRRRPRRSLGAEWVTPLASPVMPEVDRLAQQWGSSRFGLMLSAFFITLARLTGQRDLVLGTPVTHRGEPGLGEMVGCWVNTLALRPGRLAEGASVATVTRQVGQTLTDALEHQALPFARLVADLDPERDSARNPLVEAVFGLHAVEEGQLDLPGLHVEPEPLAFDRTPFDLMVTVRPLSRSEPRQGEAPRWEIAWRYARDLFDVTSARRHAELLAWVLDQATTSPNTPWHDLAVLDPTARHQLLVEWSGGEAPEAPRGENDAWLPRLLDGLRQLVERPILETGSGRWVSADQLVRAVEGWATVLRRGLTYGEARVGVLLERSPEQVALLLAVMAAGAVAVPLDPRHPPARLSRQLKAVRAGLLLGRGATARAVAQKSGVAWVDLESWTVQSHAPRFVAGAHPTPEGEQLAQLIFTSGSSGEPKAVAVSHRALGAYLESARRRYPWSGRGVPCFTSMAVDLSVTAWLAPLVAGEPVVLWSEPATDSKTAQGLHRPDGWSLIKLTPSLVEALALTLGGPVHGVGALVLGGEPLTPSVIEHARRLFPGVVLFNEYGPTETTVGSMVERVAESPRKNAPADLAIGRAFEGERGWVVDPWLRPVTAGAVGQLVLAGDGLARGYWGQPAATAARFLPDPTGDRPGGRIYRTGDRARWLADGRLVMLGRLDDQLSVRGFRVEPGEVAAACEQFTGVRHAQVVEWGDGLGVALVAEDPTQTPPDSALRDHLRQVLPAALVPLRWCWLERLPLAASGKVDTRALLRALDQAGLPAGALASGAAPRDPWTTEVAAVWGEVLGLEEVLDDVGFFELGGHSLAGLRLVRRLSEALQIELPVHALLEGATVAQVAARSTHSRTVPFANRSAADTSRSDRGPLTRSQRRFWRRGWVSIDDPAYHVTFMRQLRGPLEIERLAQAWERLVARHDALRTVFPEGDPLEQMVLNRGIPLQTIDWTGVASSVDPASLGELPALRRALWRWIGRRMDLRHGPLVRAAVVSLAPESNWLLFVAHHLVIDGDSLAQIERELAAGLSTAEEYPSSTAPELQLVDIAEEQGRRREMSSDGKVPALPPAPVWPRPETSDHQVAGRWGTSLTSDRSRGLAALARQRGTSLRVVLVAALGRTLAEALGTCRLRLGTVVSGRTHPAAQRTVGFLTERLLLVLDLAPHVSSDPVARVVDDLERSRRALVEAWRRSETSAADALEAEATTGCHVVLNLVTEEDGPVEWPGLEVTAGDLAQPRRALRDLGVYVEQTPRGLSIGLVFDRNRLAPDWAQRLGEAVVERLEVWAELSREREAAGRAD